MSRKHPKSASIRLRQAAVAALGGVAGALLYCGLFFTAAAAHAEPSLPGDTDTPSELNSFELNIFQESVNHNFGAITSVAQDEATEVQQLAAVDTQGFGLATQAALDGQFSVANTDIADTIASGDAIMDQQSAAISAIESNCVTENLALLSQDFGAISTTTPDFFGGLF